MSTILHLGTCHLTEGVSLLDTCPQRDFENLVKCHGKIQVQYLQILNLQTIPRTVNRACQSLFFFSNDPILGPGGTCFSSSVLINQLVLFHTVTLIKKKKSQVYSLSYFSLFEKQTLIALFYYHLAICLILGNLFGKYLGI